MILSMKMQDIDLLHSKRSDDIALVVKFATLDDLQAYQMHPVHVKFQECKDRTFCVREQIKLKARDLSHAHYPLIK